MTARGSAQESTRKVRSTGSELLRGTLDMLVLKTLAHGSLHGYGVARWLEGVSDDTLRIEEGSLYPALYRLEKRGQVASEWGTSELGRRAKYYRLTDTGRRRLEADTAEWLRFADVVSRVLRAEVPA